MEDIKPYFTKKSKVNGFNFYHYLHIKGGAGGFYREDLGGEFDFILFYASPEEMEGCDICEKQWCKKNNIPYGEGKTIEEAYANYLTNPHIKKQEVTIEFSH
jgi:hypothetical protein